MSDVEPAADVMARRTARAAARRLAAELDPGLRTHVEAALDAQGAGEHQDRFVVDPVGLGSLIVSAATLAWTVYKDLRDQPPRPTPDDIAARVRVELPTDDATPPAQRERVIEVVAEEIVDNTSG